MSSSHEERPLPYGWVKERHESGHPYYVDTQANPPRSIWVHPLDDEQYLREHPESREKEKTRPVSTQAPDKRHSSNDEIPSNSNPLPKQAKRGFFGKIKDKAIGTKEEREADKRRIAQLQEQRRKQQLAQQEQRRKQRLAQQAAYNQQYQQQHGQPQYGQPQYGYGPPPGQYGQPYQQQQQFGGFGRGGGRMGGGGMGMGGGMGGMALPLVGGMVGGLVLGEALSGGFDGPGDFDDGGGFDF